MLRIITLSALLLAATFQVNATVNNTSGGFIDINLYPYLSDVDSDNTVTINMLAKFTPQLSYFSLTNFGNSAGEGALGDLNTFYSEHNLRWKFSEQLPLDLTLQMNFRTGNDNDRHRLGFRWRIDDTVFFKEVFDAINLSWSINFHVKQFDSVPENIWQMEHVFRMTLPTLSKRLYIAGFIDHTFNQNLADTMPSSPIVGEVQLGYRLIENLFIVVEHRVNQYRRSDVNNTALGLEYMIKW